MRAFTLLELVIVLFIFALLSSIVLPKLITIYDGIQISYQRDDILAKLAILGYTAYEQGENFSLITYPIQNNSQLKPIPLEFPAGWQLNTHQPINFYSNGFCGGGLIYLSYQDIKQRYSFRVSLESPFCKPILQP
ncbi:MAG: prepilin-type N-terminal cleavage/methylation domain-containing protein [Thiomargarita sp.]|nr:prepilin-type N-terminal cleavage/methylation domain-containing protein [Thiomargarita sp.]